MLYAAPVIFTSSLKSETSADTAGIISLLTHTCISVASHITVHPQLTHAYQSSCIGDCTPNAAPPAVEIPSQIQILNQV